MNQIASIGALNNSIRLIETTGAWPMSLSSLPEYPRRPRPICIALNRTFSPRATRFLINLVLLTVIVAMLCWLRRTSSAIEQARLPALPLEFKLVQERYRHVAWYTHGRGQVERLLGPPTQRAAWEPEFEHWEAEAQAAVWRRAVLTSRVWDKWTDPNDKTKWIAVLYAEGTVHHVGKKGF